MALISYQKGFVTVNLPTRFNGLCLHFWRTWSWNSRNTIATAEHSVLGTCNINYRYEYILNLIAFSKTYRKCHEKAGTCLCLPRGGIFTTSSISLPLTVYICSSFTQEPFSFFGSLVVLLIQRYLTQFCLARDSQGSILTGILRPKRLLIGR